jgi:hypothetical protein
MLHPPWKEKDCKDRKDCKDTRAFLSLKSLVSLQSLFYFAIFAPAPGPSSSSP